MYSIAVHSMCENHVIFFPRHASLQTESLALWVHPVAVDPGLCPTGRSTKCHSVIFCSVTATPLFGSLPWSHVFWQVTWIWSFVSLAIQFNNHFLDLTFLPMLYLNLKIFSCLDWLKITVLFSKYQLLGCLQFFF